jgi:hypothetical protein
MNSLLIILKLSPLILAAVQAVEQAIPLPGQGNKKLELVLDVLKSAYDGSTDLAKQFSWDKLVAVVVPMIGQEFEVVERRSIRTRDRVFYQDGSGCLRSISSSFTSLVTPEAVVALGAGRSHFRVVDLLALSRLMEDLRR